MNSLATQRIRAWANSPRRNQVAANYLFATSFIGALCGLAEGFEKGLEAGDHCYSLYRHSLLGATTCHLVSTGVFCACGFTGALAGPVLAPFLAPLFAFRMYNVAKKAWFE